jgi:hypothetical protein
MSKKLKGKAKQAARKKQQKTKTKAKQSGSKIYDKLAKDSSANKKLNLARYFWYLRPFENNEHRVDILKDLIMPLFNNIDHLNALVKNAKNGMLTGIGGFAFQVGSIYRQFDRIDIGPDSGCDVDTMLDIFAEFLQADNPKLAPYMIAIDGKACLHWGYIGAKGNISIKLAKFPESNKTFTFVTAVKAETCNIKDYSQLDLEPEELIKKFMEEAVEA